MQLGDEIERIGIVIVEDKREVSLLDESFPQHNCKDLHWVARPFVLHFFFSSFVFSFVIFEITFLLFVCVRACVR